MKSIVDEGSVMSVYTSLCKGREHTHFKPWCHFHVFKFLHSCGTN